MSGGARAIAAAQPIDVTAGPADAAIARLALQTDVQLLFRPQTIAGCRTLAVHGGSDPLAALRAMLSPCPVEVRRTTGGAIAIVAVARPRPATPVRLPPAIPAEDIVVSALKRETYLADTAISMSVIRGSDLATRGQADLRAVAASDANLNALDTGTGQQRLIMRGMYGNGEATVGVYYDETPVTGPVGTSLDPGIGAADLELVDVDRIEALRGPQGTLYGAGSMGGTVRILFNKPSLDRIAARVTTGLTAAEHGETGETASAMLNLPVVTDVLGIRAVAYRRVSPGYIDDLATGGDRGGRVVREGGRLAVKWAPSDRVSIIAMAAIQNLHAANNGGWYPADGRYTNGQSVVTPYDSRMRLGNLTVHADLDWAALTATGSAYRWSQLRVYDYTLVLRGLRESPAGCGRLFATATCSADQLGAYAGYVDSRLPGVLYQPMRTRSESGEIRLSSTGGRRIDWTVGLFAEHRDDSVDSYALRADPATGRITGPLDITGYRRVFYTLSQKAAFADATWHGPARIDVTLGARYFDYQGSGQGTLVTPNIITGTDRSGVAPIRTRQHGASLKAELSWRPTAGLLGYLQAAQGFRPGGVNITPGLADDQRTYRADRLWSYEAGLKYHPHGGTAELDVDVYHVDWSDMIDKIRSADGAFAYNANIGPVDITGAELQTRAVPWRGGAATIGLSFIDARVARDQAEPSADGRAFRGDRIPEVPRWTTTASLHQTIPVADWTLLAGATLAYTSSYASRFNPAMTYYDRIGGRVVANLDMTTTRGAWSASLVVTNLLNTERPSTILSDPYGRHRFYSGGPRTYQVSLSRNF